MSRTRMSIPRRGHSGLKSTDAMSEDFVSVYRVWRTNQLPGGFLFYLKFFLRRNRLARNVDNVKRSFFISFFYKNELGKRN